VPWLHAGIHGYRFTRGIDRFYIPLRGRRSSLGCLIGPLGGALRSPRRLLRRWSLGLGMSLSKEKRCT
jgi:hypothetical protein